MEPSFLSMSLLTFYWKTWQHHNHTYCTHSHIFQTYMTKSLFSMWIPIHVYDLHQKCKAQVTFTVAICNKSIKKITLIFQWRIQGEGSGGWNLPLFWDDQCIWIGTYSWNPPFLKWLDPPLSLGLMVVYPVEMEV